jgi:hypothetical protein
MKLWRRILAEKRAAIVALLFGVVGNVAAYGLWVYPLAVRSAGASDRAAAATRVVQAAERDFAAARELVTGKARAEQELSTFYDKVLPADMSSALRLTYATLPAIARKTNVKFVGRHMEEEQQKKDARLGVLKVHTQWLCDYESFRRFIYEVESAPSFIIIDEVSIAQNDPGKPLTVSIVISTYYRAGANGT